MAFLDTLKLAFGNNIIMGHVPSKIALTELSEHLAHEIPDEALESFGLFEKNTPNFNTYYPDVTAEDLQPKDGEFIEPLFRALSEVIVHKNYNPVDFGQNGVLKKSMGLLKGQSVYSDHESAIGNTLGAVSDVAWQNSYKTSNGIVIPAGINAKLKIDGKSHPRVARAIMMDPPAIHSTSVTVQFLWDKSHASLTEEEFFKQLGSYDKDGKLVRRIATDVKRYHEISFVPHGADPFAQRILSGEITNPTYADVSYNSAKPTERKATKYFRFDFKSDLVANNETTTPPSSNDNTSQNSAMNKQFLLALAMVMGIKNKVDNKEVDFTEETIDETTVQNAVATLHNNAAQLGARPDITPAEVTRLQAIETQFNGLPKDTAALAAFRETQTTQLRAETLKNYNLIAGTSPDASITALIEKGDYAVLQALNTTYLAQVEAKFPLSCKKCNSTEVSRASVKVDKNEKKEKPTQSDRSLADIQQEMTRKNNSKFLLAEQK